MLLIVALLMFVGFSVFGGVGQDVEPGLTVEALMLPTEKTVEAKTDLVNVAYAEIGVLSWYNIEETINLSAPYYDVHGALQMVLTHTQVRVALIGGVAVRLKYPLLTLPIMSAKGRIV